MDCRQRKRSPARSAGRRQPNATCLPAKQRTPCPGRCRTTGRFESFEFLLTLGTRPTGRDELPLVRVSSSPHAEPLRSTDERELIPTEVSAPTPHTSHTPASTAI